MVITNMGFECCWAIFTEPEVDCLEVDVASTPCDKDMFRHIMKISEKQWRSELAEMLTFIVLSNIVSNTNVAASKQRM